jgi:hypothetical protein
MIIVKSVHEASFRLILIIDYSSVHVDGIGGSMLPLSTRASSHIKDCQHQYRPRSSLPPFQHHDDMVLSGCRNWNDGGSKSEARPSYPVL